MTPTSPVKSSPIKKVTVVAKTEQPAKKKKKPARPVRDDVDEDEDNDMGLHVDDDDDDAVLGKIVELNLYKHELYTSPFTETGGNSRRYCRWRILLHPR